VVRTICDLGHARYRAVTAQVALGGRTLGALIARAAERRLLDDQRARVRPAAPSPRPWIGGMREDSLRVQGPHDLANVRASIATAHERE